jgi:hypothetical protein
MVAGVVIMIALVALGGLEAKASVPVEEAKYLPSAASRAKISADLRAKLGTNSATKIAYAVVLSQQANVANDIRDWNARGRYVLETLQWTANSTQAPIVAVLTRQREAGNVESFKSYYIVNALSVTGNLASAEAVAALPGVARVDVWHEATVVGEAEPAAPPESQPHEVGWHVDFVRAPQAWAMGYDGKGVTVGNMMTGDRYTHRTIVHSYRGFLGAGVFDHNYNWFDTTHWNRPVPYDDSEGSSGTMHLGIMTGDDGHFQVGIAPGAKWIDVKWVDAFGAGNEERGLEAMQFMLAPWDLNGQNPDPTKRPAVVSNPWDWSYYTHDCSSQTIFRSAIQAWVAAGIFPSFSAGDSGEYGNRVPAAYPETFETGATFSDGTRIPASAMGPSCFDGGQLPQVMAGSSVIWAPHSMFDSAFAYAGIGSSQAIGAGAVAIVKQANPELTVAETWYVLTSTAYMDPNWGPRPNNEYGWGLLQIDAAVSLALQMRGTPTPTITGTPQTSTPVTGTPTRTPIATPTYLPPACGVTTLLREDFESGTLGLFTSSMDTCDPGGCRWEPDDVFIHSGGYSAFAPNYSGRTDSRLTTTSPVIIPASATQAELSFWTRHEFQGSAGIWYGAGVLEFSTDGGNDWTDAEFLITEGGYQGEVVTDPVSQCILEGRHAWVGGNSSLGHWYQVRVDLNPFLGQSVLFRFRLGGCNFSPGSGGWIDDLAATIVEPCVTGTPPTVTHTATPTPYLYDQYNSPGDSYTISANFVNIPDWTSQAADDFTVPAGQSWTVTQVDVDGYDTQNTTVQSVGVYIYADAGGLPGTPVYSQTTIIPLPGIRSGDLLIPLNPPATLLQGTYWISVQENDSGPGWWDWTDRYVVNGTSAAWRNPDQGMREGCPEWGRRWVCWGGPNALDQVFRLSGTAHGMPSPTNTATYTPTSLPGSTGTSTSVVTALPTLTPGAPSATIQATVTSILPPTTPVACLVQFIDVPSDHTFYSFVRCLACRDIISGYSDGTFRPNNEITRGQIAKVVSNAAALDEDPGPQVYEDVAPDNTFYTWINRLSLHGFMGGYPCGEEGEPCGADNKPYFRPFSNATRGQLAKIVANAAGVGGTPTGLYYIDVPEDNPFYTWIMRLTALGAISGYQCGGEGEPCDDANRPYFRPFNNVTRGQASKIVANTFFPDCQVPARE